MATTPGGLPYPVGTDLVVDGDDQIRALATTIDSAAFGGSSRIRASAASAALPINAWATVPLNTQTDLHVPSSAPAFTYTSGASGFTINTNGLYLVSASLTLTSALFLGRIINGGTTLAQQSKADAAVGTTMTMSVARWLTAGAVITLQVFPTAAALTTPVDSAGAPVWLTIAALTKVN